MYYHFTKMADWFQDRNFLKKTENHLISSKQPFTCFKFSLLLQIALFLTKHTEKKALN